MDAYRIILILGIAFRNFFTPSLITLALLRSRYCSLVNPSASYDGR